MHDTTDTISIAVDWFGKVYECTYKMFQSSVKYVDAVSSTLRSNDFCCLFMLVNMYCYYQTCI